MKEYVGLESLVITHMTIQPIIRIFGKALDHHHPSCGCYIVKACGCGMLKGCGCYIVKVKDENDRAWVTFTTYYTCHYLYINHMSEYRRRKAENLPQR